MLPPGVKLENTYIPYQQGSRYTTPGLDEGKKAATKGAGKHRAVGFEDDDKDSQPEEDLKGMRKHSKLAVKPAVPASQSKKESPSGFKFLHTTERPAESTSKGHEAPAAKQEDEYFLVFLTRRMLEKRVMAGYLQPGGARVKMSKDEKQAFLFKAKNLSKPAIIKCILEALSSPDSAVVLVRYIIVLIPAESA